MYLVTVLLMALATTVTVGEECGGSICVPMIDPNCKAENMPCANLYFYNETGGVVHIHQGTSDAIGPDLKGVKGVAKVQTVGEYGCYIIYKKKKHNGNSFCWKGNDRMAIGPDSGTDYEYTIVRSAEYFPVCPDCPPSKAGIPAWAIAVSVLVVLLVAVAIFLVYRRKKNHELVSTNDGA